MMGKQEAQVPLFVPGFDLGSRVRPDRPLRRVKAAVDFGFVRECVADRYGYNGCLWEPRDALATLRRGLATRRPLHASVVTDQLRIPLGLVVYSPAVSRRRRTQG